MKQGNNSSPAPRRTAETGSKRRAPHGMGSVRRLSRLLCLAAALCLLFALWGPAQAEDMDSGVYTYVLDTAGLLDGGELDALEDEAAEIAATYGFAPYIVTVEDLYGMTATDLALSYYDEHDMGWGESRDGSILLLSMAGRDFAYELWDNTNAVFDAYRRDSVQEAFLDHFRNDDWYGGFSSYLFATEYYLTGAADDVEEGEDYAYYGDYEPDYGRYEDSGISLTTLLLLIAVPLVVAGLICSGMAAAMKSVRHAAYAGNYVRGDVKVRIKEDRFTHTTETRTRIEKESSHSSSSGGGGGGGGGGHFSSSGKF